MTGYLLHYMGDDCIQLCKILKEFDNKEDAMDDLANILSKQKTEKQLLKENAIIQEKKWSQEDEEDEEE